MVRFNVSQNDARKNGPGAVHIWNGGSWTGNSQIYNHTIYISPAASAAPAALHVDTPTATLRVWNNIFITGGGLSVMRVAPGQAGFLLQGNSYWASGAGRQYTWAGQSYATLSALRAATGQERIGGLPTGFEGDPDVSAPGMGEVINNADIRRAGLKRGS